jgi:hypothetical protein
MLNQKHSASKDVSMFAGVTGLKLPSIDKLLSQSTSSLLNHASDALSRPDLQATLRTERKLKGCV